MEENGSELEGGDVVDSPQAGGDAGDQPTSDNDDGTLEGSHNDTPDEWDPDKELARPDDSDEMGDDGPPLTRARQQAARYRRQLRETEAALWAERVAALGLLADPDDLEFDADALHDPDRIRALAEELVTRKPHLKTRRIRERAGQGIGAGPGGVNLAAMLARRA